MSSSTSKNSANALISEINKNNRKKVSPSVYFNNRQPQHLSSAASNNKNNNTKGGSFDGLSDLSSNLSSNNLTCSDLDTTNNNGGGSSIGSISNGGIYDLKSQRKKLIKCILREDLDVIVSQISFLSLPLK